MPDILPPVMFALPELKLVATSVPKLPFVALACVRPVALPPVITALAVLSPVVATKVPTLPCVAFNAAIYPVFPLTVVNVPAAGATLPITVPFNA